MMPRFITKLEMDYDKKFPDSHAGAYYHEFKQEEYFGLLEKAIERNSAVTTEELIDLYGSEENYLDYQAYLREWYNPNA